MIQKQDKKNEYSNKKVEKEELKYSNLFFNALDGIRSLVRSRGLGYVYKIQNIYRASNGNQSKPNAHLSKT